MTKLMKILVVIAWMCLIFSLSNIPAKSFPVAATNYEEILAHFFLYAVLSFLLLRAALAYEKNKHLAFYAALFILTLYAISDEFHQGFVPGRSVSFADLAVDVIAGLVVAAVYWLAKTKPKLLLHVCCASCGVYISQLLKKKFKVILYFYNPNIDTEYEHKKRLDEAKKVAGKFNLRLMAEPYNHKKWLKSVKGLEHEPERGKRCLICYHDRLAKTAATANKVGAKYFTTTLSTSPHKEATAINKIGNQLAKKYNLNFLEKDFKKQDGFKKSTVMSKQLGLYRQDYCGCEFSKSKILNSKS